MRATRVPAIVRDPVRRPGGCQKRLRSLYVDLMTNLACWTRALICTIALAAAPGLASAQEHAPDARTTALTTAALASTSVVLFPFDARIARWSQREALHRFTVVDRGFTTVEWIAGPGSYALVGATYVIGRVAHERRTSDVSLHTGVAMLAAGGVTQVLKRTLGRARPYVVHDTNSGNWKLFRGFRELRGGDYLSLPSGHATTAFALASALSNELSYEDIAHAGAIRPVLYVAASTVAAARVYHDRHWASDVMMGAAVGYATGRLVTRWEHRDRKRANESGAAIANFSAITTPSRTLLSVTLPFPRRDHD